LGAFSVKTSLPPGGVPVPKKVWKREDYSLRQDIFLEMLQEMDTGPPSVDTFSNGSSKKCALAWSEFDDAFSQNWSHVA